MSGRPLVIPPQTLERLDALVAAWLPGTEGGGVADVLFGERPFSGQLGFGWPRSTDQATKAARSQRQGKDGGALFPRGYGLKTTATKSAEAAVELV